MMKIARHHIFEQDTIAGAGRQQSEPAAERPGSDDRDGDHAIQWVGNQWTGKST
jgi:hypothetical protein